MSCLSKFKIGVVLAIVGVFSVATLLTAFLFIPKTPVDAFKSVDDSNAVVVGDIWNSSAKAFNGANFQTLLNYISSNGTISGVNTNEQTAQDIRGYTYGGKDPNKSVVVTIGNYKWQVVYLTRTNNTSGDRIATLLMTNNDGTSRYGGSSDSGSNYGPNDFTNGYPTSMYGLSYIRAYTLNNGGPYVEIPNNSSNPTDSNIVNINKSASHKYSLYTVESQGLTQYLVQPQDVWYQTEAQLTGSNNPTNYTLNNESLSTTINTGWSVSNTYQTKNYYTEWGDDYLWLPSISEAGARDSELGIWELSTTERSASSNWWPRSGFYLYSYHVAYLDSSGSGCINTRVNRTNGVRPALHLNLDKIVESISSNITALSNNDSYGTVLGGGSYLNGTTATLTATANSGYKFLGWDTNGDNTPDITANPHTFTVSGDATFTAIFEPPLVLIRTNDPNLGKIIVNGQVVDSAQLQQAQGTQITELIAFTTSGSAFLYWLDEATETMYTDNPLNYTVGSEDTTLTAVFSSALMDGIAVAAQNGGEARISGYDDDMTTVHLTAVAYAGYEFAGWYTYGDNQLISTSATCDLPLSTVDNKLLIAHFVPKNTPNSNPTLDNTGDQFSP